MADKKKTSRAKDPKIVAANRKKANKKNIAKRSDYSKVANDVQGLSFIKTRFKYKFTTPEEFPIDKIVLKPSLFQGRTTPFASETVDKILREGFDKSQDPIVLFYDEKTKENIVISGHSRFEGAKQVFKKGKDKTLKTIPVKFFNGDLDEAIDYALIESNRSGKAEGVESDIKVYLRAKQRGYNKNFLRSIFKSDSYISILKLLSLLNPNGKFIELLKKGDNSEAKSFPYLLRNATWVGQLMLFFNLYDEDTLELKQIKITKEHENEIFNFFYKDNGLKVKKDSFFNLIKKKVENFDFDSKKPLQLTKIKEFDMIKDADPAIIRYNSLRNALENANSERFKKEENAIRAKLNGDTKLSTEYAKQANDIAKLMLVRWEDFVVYEKKVKKENERLKTSGLF